MNPRCKPLGQDIAALLALAFFSVGLGIFARHGRESPPEVEGIAHPALSLAEFRQRVEARDTPIIDARDTTAFDEGHVPGALSLPAWDFDNVFLKLKATLPADKNRLLVVYCSDLWCGQADMVQQKLINQGYRHVGRFPDGWDSWSKAGLPVERAP